jgi:hypothetical protein
VKEVRSLSDAVRQQKGYELFFAGGVGEPEEFLRLVSAESVETFESFINLCYRSLVEPLDRVGRAKDKGFFYNEFKHNFPDLFDALYRIRAYRHWRFHSEPYPQVKEAIRSYFDRDLGQAREASTADDFRAVQQIVLDELQLAIQAEIARLGD